MFQLSTWSQDNLVPNGNFDESLTCPGNKTIAHWFVPQNNAVDISNLCSYIDWWRFIRDPRMGLDGSQCGFVETYYKGFADDNIYSGRLYLATKLQQPLQAGRQYYFEMMVRAVDTFPNFKLINTVFTNGQDISFTKELPLFDFDLPRNFLSLRPVATNTIQSNYRWHKMSKCFTAAGNEHFLIIGNFRNDANTETVLTGKRNPNFPNGLIANYAIDNVVLTPMEINLTDTSYCLNDSLVINLSKSTPPDLQYEWHDGSTSSHYNITKNEQVQIKLKYSEQCQISKTIQAQALKTGSTIIEKNIDTSFCEGEQLILSGGIHLSGQSIKWDHGSTTLNRMITQAGRYTSRIENKCGLMISQSFNVKTKDCTPGIFLPNIFTPNGDGINDEFKPLLAPNFPELEVVEFSIFNRWGERVYQARNVEDGWDGRHGTLLAPAGVYTYSLKIKIVSTASTAGWITRQGDLSLLRP